MSPFRPAAVWAALFLITLVVLFAFQSRRRALSPEPLYVIESDLEIEAPAAAVWRALVDFPSYPEWNPYAIRVEGRLALGETIELTLVQEDWAEPMTLRPKIVRLESGRELGWHGRVIFAGLHETDHYFQLVALGANRTRLYHAEEFRGWLPEHVQGPTERAYTEKAFRAMNEALKRRAEGDR